jgi:hypothetical protein
MFVFHAAAPQRFYAAANNFELHLCATSLTELMNFIYEVANERTVDCLRNSVSRKTRDMHNVKARVPRGLRLTEILLN